MNMGGGSSNGYLSSSLPNREPVGMSTSLFNKGIVPTGAAIGGQHQTQQQVIPPGMVPRSNSIGHRALPSVASTSSMKTGASDSSPIISIVRSWFHFSIIQILLFFQRCYDVFFFLSHNSQQTSPTRWSSSPDRSGTLSTTTRAL